MEEGNLHGHDGTDQRGRGYGLVESWGHKLYFVIIKDILSVMVKQNYFQKQKIERIYSSP